MIVEVIPSNDARNGATPCFPLEAGPPWPGGTGDRKATRGVYACMGKGVRTSASLGGKDLGRARGKEA